MLQTISYFCKNELFHISFLFLFTLSDPFLLLNLKKLTTMNVLNYQGFVADAQNDFMTFHKNNAQKYVVIYCYNFYGYQMLFFYLILNYCH